MWSAPAFVTFAARVLLGALFLFAGASKVGHFNELAASIAGFRILPQGMIATFALVLPFFEIGVGAYLAAGFLTRGAAIVAAAQLAVYGAAIAAAVLRHLPANCGCFGPADRATADWPHVAADFALAALCLLLARRAPGAFAIDSRMKEKT